MSLLVRGNLASSLFKTDFLTQENCLTLQHLPKPLKTKQKQKENYLHLVDKLLYYNLQKNIQWPRVSPIKHFSALLINILVLTSNFMGKLEIYLLNCIEKNYNLKNYRMLGLLGFYSIELRKLKHNHPPISPIFHHAE